MLAERGFDTIVCFALGYARGETYYPSELADPHPELGARDLLGDVVRASHAHGLQAFAYVNALFGGPRHAGPHPDWCQRTLAGSLTVQGDATAMCPLSPYGGHIADVVREIAHAYEIDGLYLDEASFQSWCACGFCRERHRAITGREIPLSIAFGDAAFGSWLDWRAAEIASFVGRVGGALRAVRPGATFMAQHAFPLAAPLPAACGAPTPRASRPSSRVVPADVLRAGHRARRRAARCRGDRALAADRRDASMVARRLRFVRALRRTRASRPAAARVPALSVEPDRARGERAECRGGRRDRQRRRHLVCDVRPRRRGSSRLGCPRSHARRASAACRRAATRSRTSACSPRAARPSATERARASHACSTTSSAPSAPCARCSLPYAMIAAEALTRGGARRVCCRHRPLGGVPQRARGRPADRLRRWRR